MAEKSADIQTIAPRLSVVEDQAKWLMDNRGSGGGGADPSPKLQELWKATVTGAQPGAWEEDPWKATDLIYGKGSPEGLSMHQTIFGLGGDGLEAMKCQEGAKGLYGWIFPPMETRWQFGPEQGRAVTLASDIFGYPGDGYLESLRAEYRSLCKAVWGDPSNIDSANSIIDRIEDIIDDMDRLRTRLESKIERLQSNFDDQIWELRSDIDGQLAAIRARLAAGGL